MDADGVETRHRHRHRHRLKEVVLVVCSGHIVATKTQKAAANDARRPGLAGSEKEEEGSIREGERQSRRQRHAA